MGARSSSDNTTTNNITNYSLQGMESAETVVAGNGNTVTTTDHGAVDGAFEFGELAVDSALDFGESAVDGALGFGESALELAGAVVSANGQVVENAMTQNSALASETIGFASDAIESSIESNASSTAAIKDLATSLASDGASDVLESSNKMIYTLAAVFAVVVLGLVLMSRVK